MPLPLNETVQNCFPVINITTRLFSLKDELYIFSKHLAFAYKQRQLISHNCYRGSTQVLHFLLYQRMGGALRILYCTSQTQPATCIPDLRFSVILANLNTQRAQAVQGSTVYQNIIIIRLNIMVNQTSWKRIIPQILCFHGSQNT